MIGIVLSFAGPLVYSVWVETRFVQRWAAALYGVASISFGIMFYYDAMGSQAGIWAATVCISLGSSFILAAIFIRNIWNDARSLVFSYKTLAGFQLGFLFLAFYPAFFGSVPQLAETPLVNIVMWGLFLTMMLHSSIAPVRFVKN